LRQDWAVPTESDKVEPTEHELREVVGYAADCARRALSIFEQSLSADTRPRDAIDAAHAFAAGDQRTSALRQSAWVAYRAAREAASPAAVDAARAASHAAAAAYLHPKANAHQVQHILGTAAHAARAEELASEQDQRVTARTLDGRVITHQQRSPRCSAVCLSHLPEASAWESSFAISTPLCAPKGHRIPEARAQILLCDAAPSLEATSRRPARQLDEELRHLVVTVSGGCCPVTSALKAG
jgi:hypothetical protein